MAAEFEISKQGSYFNHSTNFATTAGQAYLKQFYFRNVIKMPVAPAFKPSDSRSLLDSLGIISQMFH